MEYKPVANIVVVGTVGDLIRMSAQALRGTSLSFLVNLNDASQLEAILKFIFSENCTARFSITIDERNEKSGHAAIDFKWAELMSIILTHPGYLSQSENYQMFVYPNVAAGHHDLSIPLKDLFRKLASQGYDHFTIMDISQDNQLSNEGSSILNVPEEALADFGYFNKWYASNLTSAELPLTLIISNLDSLTKIIDFKERSESEIMTNDPHLLQLMRRLRAKGDELDKVHNEKFLIAEDLKSKKDYLDFLLSKAYDGNIEFGDLARMRKFYHYEYEILPLWYKRFGHVIKVISGKRSFRSLFDDEVKKYKD